jgi:hypothetical protein
VDCTEKKFTSERVYDVCFARNEWSGQEWGMLKKFLIDKRTISDEKEGQ